MIILDRESNPEAVFNLTEHDLWNSDDYAELKALLLEVAQASD